MKPVIGYIAARIAGLSTVLIALGILPGDSSAAATPRTVGVALGGVLTTIFPEGSAAQ